MSKSSLDKIWKFLKILILGIFLFSGLVHAKDQLEGGLAELIRFQDAQRVVLQSGRFSTYVVPNELSPSSAEELTTYAGKAAYISVGTERGFISAALAGSSHLILIDQDADVIIYNKINIAMLKLSESFEEYQSFRDNNQIFFEKIGSYQGENRQILQVRELLLDIINRSWLPPIMEKVNLALSRMLFRKTYVNNASLYSHLKQLADENKIVALKVNLADAKKVKYLVSNLQSKNIRISVLDISNVTDYLKGALARHQLLNSINVFGTIAEKTGLVLMTSFVARKHISLMRLAAGMPAELAWRYAAFTFEKLNKIGGIFLNVYKFRQLISLNSGTTNMLDGKPFVSSPPAARCAQVLTAAGY